ncbi:MAG: hypothetical protein ABIN23_07835 [candidate division WOR-3 bacterium]
MKIINIPKVLREKLGDDGVDALLELIENAIKRVKEDIIEIQTEKYERRITDEVSKLDKRITDEISKLRVEMREEISNLRVEFNERISKTYGNLIKWMFIFWVGQIGVITAILFTFLKFIR